MRHNPLPSAVLAAALSACQAQPELLNSERIEQQFGSYGIEVLQQQDGVRRSNLYSVEDSGHVCRTYAVVEFIDLLEPALASTHEAVIGGQSIGTSFTTAGWQLTKDTVYVGSVKLSGLEHTVAELMHLQDAVSLGLHAYQLVLHKHEQAIHYATIIELHHPDYLNETELSRLYANDIEAPLDSAAIQALINLVLN